MNKKNIATSDALVEGASDERCIMPRVGKLLGGYAADTLDAHDVKLFSEHLLICPECRSDYYRLCKVIDAIKAEPDYYLGDHSDQGE
jgi:hypothetical protein